MLVVKRLNAQYNMMDTSRNVKFLYLGDMPLCGRPIMFGNKMS